jgi:hypothetical protein
MRILTEELHRWPHPVLVQALIAAMLLLHTHKHEIKRNTRIRALGHRRKISEEATNFRCLLYLLVKESSVHTPHQYFGLPSSLNYSFRRNKAQYSNKQTPFYQHKRAPAVGSGSKAGANLQRWVCTPPSISIIAQRAFTYNRNKHNFILVLEPDIHIIIFGFDYLISRNVYASI